jgi:hypothetical protein
VLLQAGGQKAMSRREATSSGDEASAKSLAVAEIYEQPNPLRAKVSYGPEGIDDKVLAKAEAAIANLGEEFLSWIEQDVKAAQQKFDSTVDLPEGERDHSMHELFNLLHDMKGQGGSFCYPLVTTIANGVCRFVESRSKYGPHEMDAIQLHIDALRMVVAHHLSGDGGYVGEKVLKGLEKVLAKFDH